MDTSQLHKVTDWLFRYGNITSMQAIRMFGATRLSAIIYSLRHHYGYNIVTERVQGRNKYGHNVNYAKYILIKEKEDGKN